MNSMTSPLQEVMIARRIRPLIEDRLHHMPGVVLLSLVDLMRTLLKN